MPFATETKSNFNTRILEALEEKGLDCHAYEIYMNKKYGHTSLKL